MKKVPVVKIATPDAALGWPVCRWKQRWRWPMSLPRARGLLAFSTAAGLVVMQQMLAEELAGIVGRKHARCPTGSGTGMARRPVRLSRPQKVTVARPRGRFVDGGEVELATWETFASEDLLRQVVVERMLAGVATRRHVDVTEPVGPSPARRRRSRLCHAGSRQPPKPR